MGRSAAKDACKPLVSSRTEKRKVATSFATLLFSETATTAIWETTSASLISYTVTLLVSPSGESDSAASNNDWRDTFEARSSAITLASLARRIVVVM